MIFQNIPTNWFEIEVGAIADVVAGGTPKAADTSNFSEPGTAIPWLTPADLTKYKNKYISLGKRDLSQKGLDTSSAKLMPKGAVLFSSRAPIGYVAVANNAISTNQGFKSFIFSEQVDSSFAYYFLRSIRDLAESRGSGTTFKELSGANAKKLPFLLLPLAEQKQIATKLDELLAQVDTLKTRLDTIPTILKRFRQSVLAAAVSGKLTEEWRKENSQLEDGASVLEKWLKERRETFEKEQNKLIADGKHKRVKKFREPLLPDLETTVVEFPSNWAIVSVSQFAECLDQIRIPVKKEHRSSAKGLYPYFGANGEVDRVDEYLFDDDLVLVTEDETFYGRVKPIAYRYTGKCWVNNHVHVLRAPTQDANDFLCYALMYYHVIPWLSGTTGRAKLTQGALNSLPIGLPPIEEQSEIVRRVEQYFTFADQIEQRVKDAQKRVNNLTQSILAKAFRGELTADWREQNPDLISGENCAEALLAKIKAEREKLSTKTKAVKKGRKKESARIIE